ncbi:hypothetical protein M0805_006520 [Coniferiporia weirii]|nr:hypothetical protein M0805_006520 [Coniferiporia weirii]
MPGLVHSHSADNPEDEHVDIEDDWRGAYVPLMEDAILQTATRAKLRLAAQNWRSVTALVTEEPKRTKVTTALIAGETLIAPFMSTMVPSAAYLADPLNAYAHMGMPMPHVHLVPPPLPVD